VPEKLKHLIKFLRSDNALKNGMFFVFISFMMIITEFYFIAVILFVASASVISVTFLLSRRYRIKVSKGWGLIAIVSSMMAIRSFGHLYNSEWFTGVWFMFRIFIPVFFFSAFYLICSEQEKR